MTNKLKEATFLTIKDLKRQSIILPGRYSDVFEYHAKNLDLNIDDKKIIIKDLQQDEKYIDKIVKKTSESLTELQEKTTSARKAIQDKDEQSLSTINDELLKMQDQIDFLQKELFSDPLTNAYNRKWLSDNYLKDNAFVNNGFFAFLDLNKFKFINDNYGHIVGDHVLKYLVKFLEKEFEHPSINIVRYAGDEFIVLFNKDKSTILNVDKKMKEAQEKLSKLQLKSAKIKELKISFSYGMTSFKKEDNFDKILEIADELMYENKQVNK